MMRIARDYILAELATLEGYSLLGDASEEVVGLWKSMRETIVALLEESEFTAAWGLVEEGVILEGDLLEWDSGEREFADGMIGETVWNGKVWRRR